MQEIKDLLHCQYSAIEDRLSRVEDQQFTSINKFLLSKLLNPRPLTLSKKHLCTVNNIDLTNTTPRDLLKAYNSCKAC
jgi:hypothetical protein